MYKKRYKIKFKISIQNMKILFIKVSIFFSLILLNSCDKSYLNLTKQDNSLEKKNLLIYLVMKTPSLIISGPFLKSDKIKASKNTCKNPL